MSRVNSEFMKFVYEFFMTVICPQYYDRRSLRPLAKEMIKNRARQSKTDSMYMDLMLLFSSSTYARITESCKLWYFSVYDHLQSYMFELDTILYKLKKDRTLYLNDN